MSRPDSLVARAQAAVAARLAAGDLALDATVGRGGDTLFLARAVGPGGHVHGFDRQADALTLARRHLQQAGLADRVSLWQVDHARLAEVLPAAARGRIRAAMFNLGYLPGGDRGLVTRADSTLAALGALGDWLSADGVVSVIAYTGHPGGLEEAEALADWSAGLDPADWSARWTRPPSPVAPRWLWLRRGFSA